MYRSTAAALMLAAAAVGAVLSGCTAHPVIRSGDANSVEVSYAGSVAGALPLARQHCAQFERIPRFVEADEDLTVFECVRR